MNMPGFTAENGLRKGRTQYVQLYYESGAAALAIVPAYISSHVVYPVPPWDPCIRCYCTVGLSSCFCIGMCQ